MNTKHGYPILFQVDENTYPYEWEYIVAKRPASFQPFVSWIRNKKTGETFHGWYCDTLNQATRDAVQRSKR